MPVFPEGFRYQLRDLKFGVLRGLQGANHEWSVCMQVSASLAGEAGAGPASVEAGVPYL